MATQPRMRSTAVGTGWRAAAFEAEMAARRASYARPLRLGLFAGTWNVNGQSPEVAENLHHWLFPAHTPPLGFDLYMIGLQEIQSLSGVDAVRADVTRGRDWRLCMDKVLSRNEYELVAERQLVGILILVYVKTVHRPFLSDVGVSYAGTGFLNALGNKGGVAARFRLYDRLISCVSCHLAAHEHNVDRRNQDFRDVVRKAVFPSAAIARDLARSEGDDTRRAVAAAEKTTAFLARRPNGEDSFEQQQPTIAKTASGLSQGAAWIGSVASAAAIVLADVQAGANSTALADPNAISVLDHDAVFWLGDLNYRVVESSERVINLIEKKDWSSLCDADQLCNQMQVCDAFGGFREGPICFAPTYKLERFKDMYSRDENGDLKRTPAYTDRILWRRGFPNALQASRPEIDLVHYSSAPTVLCSDHRPVSATFAMKFFVDDPVERAQVAKAVHAELDIREAELRPSIRISMRTLSLGSVRFEQRVTARLVVTNDGRVPVSLSISRDRFPAWLSLCDPRQQTISALDPKDSVGIMFQALVTAQSGCSAALGCGEQKLEVSLYVRVNGVDGIREDFEIKGRYIQTCLGTTLDVLAMCLEPLQFVRTGEEGHRDREHDESEYRAGQSPVPLPMPKEIWWLVDLLWRKRTMPHTENREGRGTWRWIDRDSRLFLATGDLEMVEVVQECIDTGSPVPGEVDGLATASCLLRLLRSLEEPVIPFTAYSSALEAGKSRDPAAVTALLTKISPLHCNVFQYIVRLAREMPSVRDGSAVQEIAEIFGEALLSPDKSRTGRDIRERAAFMRLALKMQKDAPYAIMVVDIARSSLYHGGKSRSSHHAHHQHRAAVEHRHDSRHEHRQEYRHELEP